MKSFYQITRYFLIFCICSFMLTPEMARAQNTSSSTLEVMTYNIRTGKAMDGLDAWPLRKTRTVQLIKKYHPDLLGVQEALQFQISYLLQELPGYAVIGAARDDGRDGNEFSAIIYNTKRLQLIRSDTFWLSDTPAKPGSATWGNQIPRVCTWAYFRDNKTGRFFYHFNTHFDHMSQPSRVQSAQLMLRRISKLTPKDPVIMTGDFNAAELNQAIKAIKSAGFQDTFRVLHPDEKQAGTTNAFNPKRGENKIDFIFTDNGWNIIAADIRDDKIDDRWPSDHLGVTATVELK